MKTIALALASLLSLGAAASAQERFSLDSETVRAPDQKPWASLREDRIWDPEARNPSVELIDSRSATADPAAQEVIVGLPFSLGLSSGYMRAHNSDQGTWFIGVQARLRLGYFAAEASIQFHQDQYQNGDVVVTQYPVQLTAFLYFIPEGPVRPYILGGVGWYYTDVNYRGVFSGIPDRTEQIFGEHLGGGLELFLGPRVSFDADLRYIFLNPSNDAVINRNFNYWQVTLGLNLFF